MARFRRATALLVSILTLQLGLTGSTLAAVHDRGHTHDGSVHAQAGAPCHADTPDDHCRASGGDSSCDAMTSCVAASMAPAASAGVFLEVPLGAVPPGCSIEPATRATAPELPPPRL